MAEQARMGGIIGEAEEACDTRHTQAQSAEGGVAEAVGCCSAVLMLCSVLVYSVCCTLSVSRVLSEACGKMLVACRSSS